MDGGMDAPRQLPQSVEYEQYVLGGLMLDPAAWHRVSDLIVEGDFFLPQHKLIFRAIKALAERNRPHDFIDVGEFLSARGFADQIENGAYPATLQMNTPSSAAIVAYVEEVTDRSRLRQMLDVAERLRESCFRTEGRNASEIGGEAQQRLVELQPAQRGGLRRSSETLPGWYDRFSERYGRGNKLTGLPTPWHDLNEITHGLQPATVYLLAARPSMGKSVAGLNLGTFTAIRGTTTGVFSLEMSDEDCNSRNIASQGEVPHDWILAPSEAEDDGYTGRVNDARLQLAKAPLFIDDTPALTVRQFEARARRMHQRNPLGLLVVDHIHDFKVDPKLARFEYGAILQCGKSLAKEWQIPVVFLAQLNRNVAGRVDKRPTLADLRESGELEQKADVILFLHREDYYDSPEEKTHLQGVVELHVAKGRNIRSGARIHLRNRFDQMRLEDWEGPLPKAPPKRRKGTDVGFDADDAPSGRDRAAGMD